MSERFESLEPKSDSVLGTIRPPFYQTDLDEHQVNVTVKGNCGIVHSSIEEWRNCSHCDPRIAFVQQDDFLARE